MKAGADNAGVAIRQFEDLTGRVSLGDTNDILHDKLPQYTIWLSCSSCKNFAALGDRKDRTGNKGGDHFELQFHAAKAAGAKVVVVENVYDVATLQGGSALRNLEASAIPDFSQRKSLSRCTAILKIEHALSLWPFTIQWQKRLLLSGAGQTKEVQLSYCTMMVASVLAK